MKFYYEGRLIRTSKTHHYTHALITPEGVCISCSSTEDGAGKEKRRYIGWCNENIKNRESELRAIETGADRYYYTDGRYHGYKRPRKSIDDVKESIEASKREIKRYETWKVVEIEERA